MPDHHITRIQGVRRPKAGNSDDRAMPNRPCRLFVLQRFAGIDPDGAAPWRQDRAAMGRR
jgi:hypothetical protein